MALALREDGSIAAHMFACTRRRGSWIPPYLFTQGRIYGEGEYDDDVDKDETFALLLEAITKSFKHKLCVYVEISDISTKMFGYRHFRANDYFPINWQEVRNSLHSMPPEDRLDDKTKEQIKALGVTPQTTYLYIQGHHLFDTVIVPILNKVCNRLRQERQDEITRMARHHTQRTNEMSCYEHSLQDIRQMLRKNTGYERSSQYQLIQRDIEQYLSTVFPEGTGK